MARSRCRLLIRYQLTQTGCGVACLVMVLSRHGRSTSVPHCCSAWALRARARQSRGSGWPGRRHGPPGATLRPMPRRTGHCVPAPASLRSRHRSRRPMSPCHGSGHGPSAVRPRRVRFGLRQGAAPTGAVRRVPAPRVRLPRRPRPCAGFLSAPVRRRAHLADPSRARSAPAAGRGPRPISARASPSPLRNAPRAAVVRHSDIPERES